MKKLLLAFLFISLTQPTLAQTQTDRQALEQIQQLLQQAQERLEQARAIADVQLAPPPLTDVRVPCGESIQAAWDGLTVLEGAPVPKILLDQLCEEYAETLSLGPKAGLSAGRRIVITTDGWTDKGLGWDGLVTPADSVRLATIRGVATPGHVIEIASGGGYVELFGLEIRGCPPNGQCDLVFIGNDTETDPANMPRRVSIRQVLLMGDPTFGTRRGIRVEGQHVSISQVWAQDIFIAGQDTQAITSNRGGRDVEVSYSYLQAGAENIMLGGATIPNAQMLSQDWDIHDVILHKPLRWQTDGRPRQVKNLFEIKQGKNITVRRVLMVNNWPAGQDGKAIVLHYTTSNPCPPCGPLENILIEDVVVLNSTMGISFQGHSPSSTSNNTEKLRDVTLRHAYFALSGTGTGGRALMFSNTLGSHGSVSIERTTWVNSGSQWLNGSFGTAWIEDATLTPAEPRQVPGGAWHAVRILNNVFAGNGRYGATTDPGGSHYGGALGQWSSDIQIAGNVYGNGPGTAADGSVTNMNTQLANYNLHRRDGEPNVSAARGDLLAALQRTSCGTWGDGSKGADCSRLEPVFAMRAYLPEP